MEEIPVFYDGQACGTIPFASLPVLRLFCQDHGVPFQWDPNQSRVDLSPGLKGKICVLKLGERPLSAATDAHHLEREMLLQIQQFLIHAGVSVVFSSGLVNTPPAGTIIQITVQLEETTSPPKVILFQNENQLHSTLLRCLESELKDSDISTSVDVRHDGQPSPITEVCCQLPADMDASTRKKWVNRCAFAVASGILRHYLTEYDVPSLACLSPAMLGILAAAPKAQPVRTAQEEPEGETSQKEKGARPAQVQGTLDAEVFFDYTVVRSEMEHQPFLILGNLYIKNTGQDVLINPIVCLRAEPPENIRLSGQILPANLVETMGIQSPEGVKGWRFLEQDWFEQAQKRGEYWIAPIQPVRIAPNEIHPFQNFQITVQASNTSSRSVTIEGFVFFREQQLQFSSNNRIALSY